MALIDTLIGIAVFIGFGLFIVSRLSKKPIKEMLQDFMEKLNPSSVVENIEEEKEKII